MFAGLLAWLSGCIEVEQRLRVHDDGSTSFKGTIKIDPQYETQVLPTMKKDLPGKLPAGVRLDFSQRIDGKAAVVMEADGEAAAEMLKQDGSTTITVSEGGFMKKRYEYRVIVPLTPEIPFPHRAVVTLPGSIESVLGGKKIAADTFEFDLTHAKRGDVFAAASTALAFSMGRGGVSAAQVTNPTAATWLVPASIGSICAGAALLLAGWIRSSRSRSAARGTQPVVVAPTPVARETASVQDMSSGNCTKCGAPNPAGRKFCSKCGHELG
jgi:hypothetical protein